MLKEKIIKCLKEMDTDELIQIHNEYCSAVNDLDSYIYSMDDFEMLCDGQSAEWIACRIFYGSFNPNNEYVTFNGYGNFVSGCDYSIKDNIYIDDIANYIVRNEDSLYNDDIQDILNDTEVA